MTPSLQRAMLALALTYWPFFTRIVFAETRRLRSALFIDALEGIGAARRACCSRTCCRMRPRRSSCVRRSASGSRSWSPRCSASSAWATPPAPDWGLTIAQSRTYLPNAWWYAMFPGLAIFVTVLGFNLLGDGLRDILDPRLRRSR